MYNYVFLKYKLKNYCEEKGFIMGIESLSDEGLSVRLRMENFSYIEEFLSKHDMYECNVLSESGNIIRIEFKMKEDFKHH